MTSPTSRLSVIETKQEFMDESLKDIGNQLSELNDKMIELVAMSRIGRMVLVSACTVGPGIGVLISKFMG